MCVCFAPPPPLQIQNYRSATDKSFYRISYTSVLYS